jgi:hypothetical protein
VTAHHSAIDPLRLKRSGSCFLSQTRAFHSYCEVMRLQLKTWPSIPSIPFGDGQLSSDEVGFQGGICPSRLMTRSCAALPKLSFQ